MTPGMTVIGPHTYRKSGMSYRRTTKNRPKKSAKPPIAKYAIGSRSSRLDVLEDTLRPTTPRVLQSGVVRIRNVRRTPSAGLRRDRGFWNDGGARGFQRLADEQHAGPGDSDKAEGNPEGRDDDQELIGGRGALVACAQQVVGEGEDVSVKRDHGDVDREESLDVLVPQHGPKELERPPLQFRSEGGFLDEELDHDDAHRDAESAHREDDRVGDPERMEGKERRSEPCDEAAKYHEVEEGHELGPVRAIRVVVDHRERRGDFRRRADPEHREEDGDQIRPHTRIDADAQNEKEDRRGRHQVGEDEDALSPDAVAQRAEVPDRRDLRQRIDREEDAPPQGVQRVHHVLHHRDPGERRGAHDQRREVEEREIPDIPRPEVEECRQFAGHESGQTGGLAISMAHTDCRRNRFAVRFASAFSELPTRKLRWKFLSKATMPRLPNRRPLPVLQSVRWTYRGRLRVL